MGISPKTKFLNKLHVLSVNVVFVFSGFCAAFLGYRAYRFMVNTRPYFREKRQQVEQELLSVGKPSEEDLSEA